MDILFEIKMAIYYCKPVYSFCNWWYSYRQRFLLEAKDNEGESKPIDCTE